MLNTTNPARVVSALFETFMLYSENVSFPQDDGFKYGMSFSFDLDCENLGYEKGGNIHHPKWERRYRKFIHIIITKGCSVFVAVSDKPNVKDVPLDQFENTSNHDSCWRDDGLRVFKEQTFAAWDYCFEHVPKEHQPLPKSDSVDCQLASIFGQPVRFVRFKTARSSKNREHDNYWQSITALQIVSAKLQLGE